MNRDVKDHLRKGEASLHLRSNDPTPLLCSLPCFITIYSVYMEAG